MSEFRFVFPMPPNIANGRMHWRVKHNAKVDFEHTADNWSLIDEIPDPPSQPIARAIISSVMYLYSPMDDDNAMHRHKWILDWLKTRRYIVDDRKKCITWSGIPTQVIDRKNPRIEIQLTQLDADSAS